MDRRKTNITRLVFIICAILFNSCSKNQSNSYEVNEIVKVNILGIDDSFGELDKLGSVNPSSLEQKIRIPYGENLSVLATLSPLSKNNTLKEKTAATTTNNLPKKEIPLTTGTKFLLLAYNSQGVKVAEREYSYQVFDPNDKGDLNTGFENLQIGQTYTFIVCSNNTTTSVPTVTNKQNLSTATVSNVSDNTQLLYFKDVIKINNGVNYLNVKLKHLFSEVTTEIIIDQTGSSLVNNVSYSHAGSVLKEITTPSISPAFESATVKLSDASRTYLQRGLLGNFACTNYWKFRCSNNFSSCYTDYYKRYNCHV